MLDKSETHKFKAVDSFEITEVPDGFVVFDEQSDKVHYLNPTAALIFTICDGTKTSEEIREFIQDAYDIDDALEIEELFSSLENAGLVCRVK